MFGKNKFSGSIEYLVVGLGNPDRKYESTRHNTGWLALDYIAEKYNCKVNKIKYKSFVGDCTIGGARVMLMKPTISEPVPDLLDFVDRLESLCPDEFHPDEVIIYET